MKLFNKFTFSKFDVNFLTVLFIIKKGNTIVFERESRHFLCEFCKWTKVEGKWFFV